MRVVNGNLDSCNSCKRQGTSRLHELYESKFPFVTRIEFILSKLSKLSAHVSGVSVGVTDTGRFTTRDFPSRSSTAQCPSQSPLPLPLRRVRDLERPGSICLGSGLGSTV